MRKAILHDIETRFGLLSKHEQRSDLMQIGVKASQLVHLVGWLRDATGYVQLTHMSAVDWIEENAFELSYMMTDPEARHMLMITVRIDREEARMDSVAHLWPQAVTYEQEMNEMFGITFPGSPRMGVPFILEDWQDMPPMRRDFDTVAYVEENHPARPGRSSIDTRTYVGEVHGEKSMLGLRQPPEASPEEKVQEPS